MMYSSKKDFNRMKQGVNTSFQDSAQMQLNMMNPKTSYNPITNPLPVNNQNPYIPKGRLDVAQSVNVRGKLTKVDPVSSNGYLI